MQPSVGAQSVTTQSGPYLEEFREFFITANLPFGSPENLTEFAGRLSKPGPFPENVSALIWSIMFRERERISGSALANLLAVAVGGATVEDEAGKLEGPLRVITVFVFNAMRSRRNMPPEELSPDEATSRQLDAAEKPAVPRRESEFTRTLFAASQLEPSSSHARVPAAPRFQPEQDHAPARRTDEAHLLFAQWSDKSSIADNEKPRVFGKPQRVAAGIILGLIALGGVVLVARPGLLHLKAAESGPNGNSSLADRKNGATGAAWCVNSVLSSTSRDDLESQYKAAKTLIDQNRPSEALPRLQEIALVDPGFPMIDLNISEAWLKLGQFEETKAALDAQYAVSSCLANLPAAGLTAYCSSELPNLTLDACRTRIAGIWQAAHTQGTLLQLAKGRSEPTASATLAAKLPGTARPASAAENTSTQRKAPAAEPRPSRRSSDRSLVDGEGTDASLGAYPK